MVQMAVSPLPQWFEGSEYTHKVAACIMKYGPISRITLAQILGLSQGAVSRITSDLIYAGVIEETPMPSGKAGKLPKGFVQKENTERRGRPQTGLQVIANARSFVGMKINATHISAVAVNAIGQIITGCHDLEIEDASPQTVVALIKQLTTDCSDEAEMAGWPKPCAGCRPSSAPRHWCTFRTTVNPWARRACTCTACRTAWPPRNKPMCPC